MELDDTNIMRFVVIATYNELSNLPRLIEAVFAADPTVRLIIVDDNSPDGSPKFLRAKAEEDMRLLPVIREKRNGYGGAMLRGFEEALKLGADSIVTLDADFSHDPASIPQLFLALEKADVAIGSRYSGGVRVMNWHPQRLLLSLFANRYVAAILGISVSDATSGFRAYKRSALEKLDFTKIKSTGYSFLVEMLYGLLNRGCTVTEVPIVYTERREGESKMDSGVILEAVFRPWKLRLRGKK